MWIVICAFFMLPISLTSDCKLKVLSETISLEAARKYDPPGFSGAANLRVVVYFAFTRHLQWAPNTLLRLTEKRRVGRRHAGALWATGCLFQVLGLATKICPIFVELCLLVRYGGVSGGDIKPSHFVILDSSF